MGATPPPHQRPKLPGGSNHIGREWSRVGDLETTLDAAGWLGWLAGWLGWLAGLADWPRKLIMV